MSTEPLTTHTETDRIVVVASSPAALDLLRLAVLRSDDVLFVAESISQEAQRYASRFAIDVVRRPFASRDLDGAAVLLVALEDSEAENRILRTARRQRVPVHVANRPVVSDVSALGLLERADHHLQAA